MVPALKWWGRTGQIQDRPGQTEQTSGSGRQIEGRKGQSKGRYDSGGFARVIHQRKLGQGRYS